MRVKMQTIADLQNGYKYFLENSCKQTKAHYKKLSEGQNPNFMIVSCADSRVEPSDIFSADAGDLFTVRNVANLVPPYNPDGHYHGTSAALEFAVNFIKVEHILILGHTGCGGIQACLQKDKPVGDFIAPWVSIAEPARYHINITLQNHSEAEKAAALEKEAICLSLENLMTFPFIKNKVNMKKLDLHGAVFNIKTAKLEWLHQETREWNDISK
jgi:carbonic anhydrase